MKRFFPAILILAAGLLPAWAQEAPKAAPQGRELLNATVAYLRGLKSFEVQMEVSVDVGDPKTRKVMEDSTVQVISAKTPDKFSLVTREHGAQIPSNDAYLLNGQGTILEQGGNRLEVAGLADIPAFLRSQALGYSEQVRGNVVLDRNMGFALFKELAFAVPDSPWEKNLLRVDFKGEELLGEQPANRLALALRSNQQGKETALEMDLWLAKDEKPLPLKLVPHVDKLLATAKEEDKAKAEANLAQITIAWSSWRIEPNLPDSAFTPPKPAAGERIFTSLQAMVDAQAEEEAKEPDLNQLLDQPAPDFEITLEDGKKLKLSEQKGKKNVILAFWASWCEPCHQSVPALLKEVNGAEDVLVLGINLEESPEEVQAFVKEHPWKLIVGLDQQSTIGKLYLVTRLPQTVLIDKAGTVRGIHLGFGPDYVGDIRLGLKDLRKPPRKSSP